MTLESQIQQFINTAKLGDVMLLSKDGGRGSGNGLILKTIGAGFTLFHEGRQLCTWNCGTPAVNKELLLWGHTVDSVLKEALLWSYKTGKELACPDPEPEESSSLEAAYQQWWDYEASADRPRPDEDQEAHVKRMTRIAWLNGAYVQKYRGNGKGLDSHE